MLQMHPLENEKETQLYQKPREIILLHGNRGHHHLTHRELFQSSDSIALIVFDFVSN